MPTVVLDGGSLTCADIAAVARRSSGVGLAAGVAASMARSRDLADAVAATRPVYGRSTGVGANRSIPLRDPVAGAAGLLASHAVAAGPLRAPERVRAMLVVRANQLAAGGSGADPGVLPALLGMLAGDDLPPVREWGGVGTGDLPALAVTARALPLTLDITDALPFLSSGAATLADAALAVVDLGRLADASLVVCALTFTAVDGNPEAFAEAVEIVTPFPGARRAARALRALVAGAPVPARIQDPFALRTVPQVHGPLLDCLDRLDAATAALANSPTENPVFLPGHEVAHHGGFHAAYLAQALDAVVLALAQSAQLSLARLVLLSDPAMTRLPAFLAAGPPAASGIMVLEYVAASALGALRALAAPASLQTVVLSRGVEDSASFAPLAARQALDAVAAYRTVLGCELVAAVRAVRGLGVHPEALAVALDRCGALGTGTLDRDLTDDLATAEGLLERLPEPL